MTGSSAIARSSPCASKPSARITPTSRDRGDAFRAQASYELALAAVADPARQRKKKDDYTARLARIGTGLDAGWPQRRTRP